jgi:cobalt-zinc-cadmium efflux system protein
MPHDHHDHAHHHATFDTHADRRRVAIAIVLTFSFMLVEIAGGIISGSLALLADAAHMLTDASSLLLAWVGFRLSELPADDTRSFGWARFKVLAAFTNGLALLVLAVWIVAESLKRIADPQPVMGDLLLIIATAGLVINVIAFLILRGGSKHDLNMQGALWHVAGDLLGSVAAITAALVILATGWVLIDPILSVVIALIISYGGIRLVRQTGHILIEGVPSGLSLKTIQADLMQNVAGTLRVDHIHAWALNESKSLITLEVEADRSADPDTVRQAVKARLASKFEIDHATVELVGPVTTSKGPDVA